MDVGVIGVGAMGKNHARVYSELKSAGNLHLFDLNTKASEELGKKVDAHVASSMDELLDSCEAVSICVPTPFHHDVAQKVFSAGVHALIEKPICQTSAEAEALIKTVPKDLTVGVGHIERFNPIIDEIRRMIHNPLYIETKRHNPASARVTGTSIVEDLMIHDIDVIFNLFPQEKYFVRSSGTPDVCGALFAINGTTVYMSASRKSSKKIRLIYIEQEDCTIEGDYMNQEIAVYRKPGQYNIEHDRYVQENIIEKVLVNKQEPLKRELSTFLECVKSGKKFPVTPEQGLFNLQVCEKITRNFVKAA
ncbi:Gfo/Idh/MocA family protein [Methanoregula sp.]|jgi:predicted dehydrogenase|uniref:Gfo/Idh/MocA family protein n=1 Tax=Methanoregula sp. TaxID=2052170 RepID=UPI0025D71C0C|nr:Gfo/Idh/MocA family oxidoreductase [Methanoregula sp.]